MRFRGSPKHLYEIIEPLMEGEEEEEGCVTVGSLRVHTSRGGSGRGACFPVAPLRVHTSSLEPLLPLPESGEKASDLFGIFSVKRKVMYG